MLDERFIRILKIFNWGPDAEKALQVLKLRVDHRLALALVAEMKDKGCAPTVYNVYVNMLKHGCGPDVVNIGRVGRLADAKKVFEDMNLYHCEPDVVTYNTKWMYLKAIVGVYVSQSNCTIHRVLFTVTVHRDSSYDVLEGVEGMFVAATEVGQQRGDVACLVTQIWKGGAYKLLCKVVVMSWRW
nr:hypothetical protein [Tanacetum cinerariifolium]